MPKFLALEPVLWMNVIRAVLVLLVLFGLPLPIGADVAVLAACEAVLTLFVRSRVTPLPASVLTAP